MSACEQRRIPVELTQILAVEHRNEPRELCFEAIAGIGLADASCPEVQWQGSRCYSKSDTTSVTSPEPSHFLSNQGRGPKWK